MSGWHAELLVCHYLGKETPEMPGSDYAASGSAKPPGESNTCAGDQVAPVAKDQDLQKQTVVAEPSAPSPATEKIVAPAITVSA